MSTIDQQFVEYIVKSLVGKPDAVSIERTIDEMGVLLKLTVDPEDLGRVIGKRGSTAQSIRTLLRALGTKNDARYNLKIIDPEGDNRPPREPRATEERPAPPPADDTAVEPTVADESADDTSSDDSASAKPEEEIVHEVATKPEDEVALPEPEPVGEPENQDTLADKTRKELAELDDLDI